MSIKEIMIKDTAYKNKQQTCPDIAIEKSDDGESIGIAILPDGIELQYMTYNQARVIAYTILAMVGDEK